MRAGRPEPAHLIRNNAQLEVRGRAEGMKTYMFSADSRQAECI